MVAGIDPSIIPKWTSLVPTFSAGMRIKCGCLGLRDIALHRILEAHEVLSPRNTDFNARLDLRGANRTHPAGWI